MYYNVRVKVYPDGHRQYIWSEQPIFRLSEEKDSPELIEIVKRRYKRIALKRKLSKFTRYDGDVPENNGPYRYKHNLSRAVAVVYDLARSNKFDWFVTLTLSPDAVDRYDYDACSAAVRAYTDRLRKYGCKWLIVPEQHKDGAYHFHGLVSGSMPLTDSGKTWYNPIEGYAQPIYNLKTYEYGWSTATAIVHPDRCATYVAKYLTKCPSVPKGKKSYWASRSLARPTVDYLLTCYDTTIYDKDLGEFVTVREHDGFWGFGIPRGDIRYSKEIVSEYGRFVISEE